jgi:hypothetical protein
MKLTTTDYKGHQIQQRTDIKSHCATVTKGGKIIKMIAGDIAKDGSHNAEEKAKKFIDTL